MLRGSDDEFRFVYNNNDNIVHDMIIVGIVVILVMTGMILIHKSGDKKTTKTEIQMEVNAAVAQYFALRGDEPTTSREDSEK